MEALGLALIFAAAAAVYAGVTGRDVLGQIRESLGGFPAGGSSPSPFAGSEYVNVDGSPKKLQQDSSSSADTATGSTNKLTEGLGAARLGATVKTTSSPYGPIPVKPTGAATVPDPSQLDLVAIGQGGHKLTRAAAAAFAAVEAAVGHQVKVTDSYRSQAQEEDLARRKPGAGVPGYSLHEVGLAVDVNVPDWNDPKVIDAMTAGGWIRWSPSGDPVHWSYWLRG